MKFNRRIEDFEGYETLNAMELEYFECMLSQSGVLYLSDRPGMAKTAILTSIAKKLNFQVIKKILSQIDETEVGCYPIRTTYTDEVDGGIYDCLDHVVPKWAYIANSKPTLVIFDELNRAQLPQRNAALQIFCEREIGETFKFNDNVFFAATGNLGESDGCDVDEFDSALRSRLIHVKHGLTLKQWIEFFAKENVNKHILSFLLAKDEHFYKNDLKSEESAFACARTWTNLSNYINSIAKDPDNLNEWLEKARKRSLSFVGSSAIAFLNYLDESIKINIKEVINNFKEIKKDIVKLGPSKTIELNEDLKYDVPNFINYNENQINNIINFIAMLGHEAVAATVYAFVDSVVEREGDSTKGIKGDSEEELKNKRELRKIVLSIIGHPKIKGVSLQLKQNANAPAVPAPIVESEEVAEISE